MTAPAWEYALFPDACLCLLFVSNVCASTTLKRRNLWGTSAKQEINNYTATHLTRFKLLSMMSCITTRHAVRLRVIVTRGAVERHLGVCEINNSCVLLARRLTMRSMSRYTSYARKLCVNFGLLKLPLTMQEIQYCRYCKQLLTSTRGAYCNIVSHFFSHQTAAGNLWKIVFTLL